MSEGPASSLAPAAGDKMNVEGSRDAFPTSACSLFPLPRPAALSMPRGLNRRSSQRMARKVRIRHEVREVVSALNWMHAGDFDSQPGTAVHPLHCEVLHRLHRMVEMAGDLGDQCCVPSQEAALRELLHGQDGYIPSLPPQLL